MTRKAFTLLEILIVTVIISIIGAVSLSVFARVRTKSYETNCLSNLHQIGSAISLYQQDYDGFFPHGGDPTDIRTDIWDDVGNGKFGSEAHQLQPLQVVLRPYVNNFETWHCPADNGFDYDDVANRKVNARPTSFEAFGTSYYYRTSLTLKRKKDLLGWESYPPYVEYGPESINVLFDGSGAWHTGGDQDPRRYNVLWGDGHVKNVGRVAFLEAWHLQLDKPSDSDNTTNPNEGQ